MERNVRGDGDGEGGKICTSATTCVSQLQNQQKPYVPAGIFH